MPAADITPEDVLEFATYLHEFGECLEARSQRAKALFTQLGQSWRDQEYEKFTEDFEATLAHITTVLEGVTDHVGFLQRKAERAEEYIEQR